MFIFIFVASYFSEADKLDKQMLEYNLKQIDSQADLDDAAKAAV